MDLIAEKLKRKTFMSPNKNEPMTKFQLQGIIGSGHPQTFKRFLEAYPEIVEKNQEGYVLLITPVKFKKMYEKYKIERQKNKIYTKKTGRPRKTPLT